MTRKTAKVCQCSDLQLLIYLSSVMYFHSTPLSQPSAQNIIIYVCHLHVTIYSSHTNLKKIK